MTAAKKTPLSRRLADHVMDELVKVLSAEGSMEFKSLFAQVFDGLKKKNQVSGGEEMLRLRCYEKLQGLMRDGLVQKSGKAYRALKGIEQMTTTHRIARVQAAQAARAGR